MKHILTGFGALVLAAFLAVPAAQAQTTPPGSYLRSCRDIAIQGGTLSALCRDMHGRWDRAALGDVNQCVGDIGNMDGALACKRAPAYGGGTAEPRRRMLRDEERRLRCDPVVDPIQHERCLRGF